MGFHFIIITFSLAHDFQGLISHIRKPPNMNKDFSLLNFPSFPTLDEDEGVANDSDTSPPQSRGRGRFEKARCKVSSRSQSDALRSASSQAADEESSSHVSVSPS